MAYEVVGWRDGALVLRVTQPSVAVGLFRALLCSKSAAHRVLARQQVMRDGRAVGPASSLQSGDELVLTLQRPLETGPLGSGPVDVLYQDEVLLVANKPAGLLVHGDGTGADTLTARVRGLLVRQGREACVQAVQRLDVATTGLVIFSLTEEFQPSLDAQVAGHDMHKRYLALVQGTLVGSTKGWLELSDPIARDRHDARRMRVGASGKPSLTRVHTLRQHNGCSLLEVELATGRKHQIRVHLAHAGHPIVGDALYGGARHVDGLMLHAWQETLTHPVTGERLDLITPWPKRFGPPINKGQRQNHQ